MTRRRSIQNNGLPVDGDDSEVYGGGVHDYHNQNAIDEKKERLCVAMQDLLTKSGVHPNDAVIDFVDVVVADPPKPEKWWEAAVSWGRFRWREIVATFLLSYILVQIILSRGFLLTLLLFVVSICGLFAHEKRLFWQRAVHQPTRAVVTIYFNPTTQLFGRQVALSAIMEFLNNASMVTAVSGGDAYDDRGGYGTGAKAFRYGYEATEGKCYITWVPPRSNLGWMSFVRNGGENASKGMLKKTLDTIRDLVVPTSPMTVGCVLVMFWAAAFLWRHWAGYSRPMDGVWRVSRYYFEGTPLSFLLLIL